jgi:hypothetical protein
MSLCRSSRCNCGIRSSTIDVTYGGDVFTLEVPQSEIQTYAPALGGSGWTLGGAGSQQLGRFAVLEPFCFFQATVVFGTGATFGVGVWPNLSLPPGVPAAPSILGVAGIFGHRTNIKSQSISAALGNANHLGQAHLINPTTVGPLCALDAAPYIRDALVVHNAPFTWAAGDTMSVGGFYEVDV